MKKFKKLKEQISYGDRPERMDPRLERGLGDPESLYAKSSALRKGSKDVERMVSSRFLKVAEKLRDVTGINDVSSQQVQGMIFREQMSKVPRIMGIEARHKDELEQLAIEACLEEAETTEEFFKIRAFLNRTPIDTSNFQYQPKEEEEEEEEDKIKFQSFDVEDLTREEEIELEKHKRNIINAIIQGSAKKAHYLFQKPDVKSRLDAIDPSLYRDYLGIMAINDFMYFTMDKMIENMSRTGNGVAGKVQLESSDGDEDEGGDEGESEPDTIINAYGLLFPILCHEIIKGIEEVKARYGLPQDPSIRQKVLGDVDLITNEPMQLRIGPEITEKIRFTLPNEMFEPENKGLINWFQMVLYQMPADEFLHLIGDVISEDKSKNKKAESEFKSIMNEAMRLKEEYESEQEEKPKKTTDNDFDEEDDDDDLSGFFDDLGIS
jgi:hypothetical protein